MSATAVRAAQGAALLGVALLAGCSWLPWSHQKAAECPAAVILQPLANTAVFAPGKEAQPQNVAFYGILDEVDSHCDFDSGAVHMHLKAYVVGQRGPAATGDSVDFDYFVAVLGPNQSIISKNPFRVRVVFPPNKLRAGVTDEIDEAVPLNGYTAKQLTFDLGFQQSPEVVNFYRHYRGR